MLPAKGSLESPGIGEKQSLETNPSKDGSHKPLLDWHHARLIIQDAMKLPTTKPVFPDPASLDARFSEGVAWYPEGVANPSLHNVQVKLSGLINKLSRSGMWRMHFCILSETALTFFSAASGELTGKVEYPILLHNILEVEDGPEVPKASSVPQPGSVILRLAGRDQKVVLAVYDKRAQEVWKAALQEAIQSCEQHAAKGMDLNNTAAITDDPGLTAICVSTAPPAMQKHGSASGNPGWGNIVVRMAPAWGDSMACALSPGSHIRVWMSNNLVCCISTEGGQQWYDSRTMAAVDQPGYKLEYKMEGVSLSPGIDFSSPKKSLQMQMASYGLLVLILNAVIWGVVPSATAYWCSVTILVAALAAGFLPGPPPPSPANGILQGSVPVRLQLISCAPDLSTQTGAALKRTITLTGADSEGLRLNAESSMRVDQSNLVLFKKQYPDETDRKLTRFLISRQHDLQAAIEMLEGERRLRASLGALDPTVALPFLSAGLLHFQGFALDGTPLLVVTPRFLNKEADTKAMQKLVLIACDLMCELAPEQQCMTVIGNLEGFSISKNVDFNKLKDCIHVLNACLPETLRRVFVLNAPYVFQAVWGFVKALLHPSTVDKVRVLSKKEWPLMKQFVDTSVLSKSIGGENDFVYDPAANSPQNLNWGQVDIPASFKHCL